MGKVVSTAESSEIASTDRYIDNLKIIINMYSWNRKPIQFPLYSKSAGQSTTGITEFEQLFGPVDPIFLILVGRCPDLHVVTMTPRRAKGT